MSQLILSLFPGVGLLDMAFEEVGFCVVRGPDLIFGGDVRCFRPPAGRFDGVIGGPPCQPFSVANHGRSPQPDLVPEFVRVVEEVLPRWWLMENVRAAPTPRPLGYPEPQVLLLENRWFGGVQARRRKFVFGERAGGRIWPQVVALESVQREGAVLASEGWVGQLRTRRERVWCAYKRARPYERLCELQGLPRDFLASATCGPRRPLFTKAGRCWLVGNGVPLQTGRAVAAAVFDLAVGGR